MVTYPSTHGVFETSIKDICALIHEHGCQAGLAINPATPLDCLDHVLDKLDVVLIMSVNPGFGGQSFIDEAYALKQRDDDSFGQECIDTILKFIEDHRDEMVVILAGYAEQMDGLLASNPGFRSRFAQRLAFDDYDDTDLLAILHGMLKTLQYRVEPATEQFVTDQLALERASGAFGNGRAVRNLIERAIRRHAVRINARTSTGGRVSPDELVLLLPEDFVDQSEVSPRARR